jgi:hypothetical protein
MAEIRNPPSSLKPPVRSTLEWYDDSAIAHNPQDNIR